MHAYPAGLKLLGFVLENPSAGRGDLRCEFGAIGSLERAAKNLPAKRRARFEFVQNFQMIGWLRQSRQGRVTDRNLLRLADNQGIDRLVLLDNARFFEQFHEWPARTIPGG